MDFFEAQELARKRSRVMVLLFLLSVLAITTALYGLIIFVTGSGFGRSTAAAHSEVAFWHPELFFKTFAGVAVFVTGCSIFKIAQLRSGGSVVARSLGGQEVAPTTSNADERMLLNIVEEMSIASGVPMPEVYLLPEDGINAFAAGFKTSDAVVAVTRGCIRSLNRDELQGVVAHEFSHILNGDMRMNIRLMGVLFGILAIAVLGRILLRFSGNTRSRGGGAVVLIMAGLAVTVIGYIGVFFGRIIQSAISRQREYLADAAAVQFTRNPNGIAGALKKIGASTIQGHVTNAHSQETAHFFFVSAFKLNLASLFATHPPLKKRIQAINPDWDGAFSDIKRRQSTAPSATQKKVKAESPLKPHDFINTIGQVSAAAILTAQYLHKQIGNEIERVRQSMDSARSLLLGLCITSSPPEDDTIQLLEVKKKLGNAIYEETKNWLLDLLAMDINQRFALFDVALPVAIGKDYSKAFILCDLLHDLAHSDGKVNLQEFALVNTTKVFVKERSSPNAREASSMHPKQMEMPLCVLLSAVAYTTGKDEKTRAMAFKEGARKCNRYMLDEAILLPEETVNFEALEAALDLFVNLPTPQKKVIFEGVLAVVLADGKVMQNELCLIRIIAMSLSLPMPPLIAK